MEKKFYVYIYLDPRKQGKYRYGKVNFLHEPIYIGKGKRKRAYDLKDHNPFLRNKLAKFEKPIILFIAKKLKQSEAFSLEKEIITLIGRHNLGKGPLCNLSDGGEGLIGAIRSPELRKQVSEKMKGIIRSQETKDKISKKMNGLVRSQETKDKIRKARLGQTLSRAIIEKMLATRKERKQYLENLQ